VTIRFKCKCVVVILYLNNFKVEAVTDRNTVNKKFSVATGF